MTDYLIRHLVYSVFVLPGVALQPGVLSALRPDSWIDRFGVTLAPIGQALPDFFLGIVPILAFAVGLGWFPFSGGGPFLHLVLPAVTLGHGAAHINGTATATPPSSVRSPHGFEASIVLEEKRVRFERVEIDLPARQQKSPAYLPINPRGQVPAYLDDAGAPLDSLNVMLRLEAGHPEPRTVPRDPAGRRLAAGTGDRTGVRTWDRDEPTDSLRPRIGEPPGLLHGVAFVTRGVSGAQRRLRLSGACELDG